MSPPGRSKGEFRSAQQEGIPVSAAWRRHASRCLLAARTGMGAFALATVAWFDDPSPTLEERFDLAFSELKSLLSAAAG